MARKIPGVKLISHNAAGVQNPDDPSLPFKLVAQLSPPGLLDFAFVLLHGGSEEIVVRGATKAALDEFIQVYRFDAHPRLRTLLITGSNGEEVLVIRK